MYLMHRASTMTANPTQRPMFGMFDSLHEDPLFGNINADLKETKFVASFLDIKASGPSDLQVATSREVKEPTSSEDIKACILNALNTLSPTMAYWQHESLQFPCAIYGFFLKGFKVTCVFLPLETSETNEYSTFFADLYHVLQANKAHFRQEDQKAIETLGPQMQTDLRHLYVKTSDSKYAGLRQHIWTTILDCKFNQTAINWFHSEFLAKAHVEAPHDFRPLVKELVADFKCQPIYGAYPCQTQQCRFGYLGERLVYEKQIGHRRSDDVLTIKDALAEIRSPFPIRAKLYLAPTILRIQESVNLRKPSRGKRSRSVLQACLLESKNCEGQLIGGWSECCAHPTVCEYHTEVHEAKGTRSFCPKHGRKGNIIKGKVI